MNVFEVERYHMDFEDGARDMLAVTCPHSECGQRFLVDAGPWRTARATEGADGFIGYVKTRSCTYCFRAALVPRELLILPDPTMPVRPEMKQVKSGPGSKKSRAKELAEIADEGYPASGPEEIAAAEERDPGYEPEPPPRKKLVVKRRKR